MGRVEGSGVREGEGPTTTARPRESGDPVFSSLTGFPHSRE
jgi:hypothetical protein